MNINPYDLSQDKIDRKYTHGDEKVLLDKSFEALHFLEGLDSSVVEEALKRENQEVISEIGGKGRWENVPSSLDFLSVKKSLDFGLEDKSGEDLYNWIKHSTYAHFVRRVAKHAFDIEHLTSQ